ncbi:hypothetical protein JHK87_029447 [Glycine soja]|nr:hypothetical protein JHK87_029447 [Glycine soja]
MLLHFCEFRCLQTLLLSSDLGYFIMCYLLGTMLPCLLWRERNRWCLCGSLVICRDVKLKLLSSPSFNYSIYDYKCIKQGSCPVLDIIVK